MTQVYDSAEDTKAHIARVQELLSACVLNLQKRGVKHDESKLLPPEKPIFDEYTPKLKVLTYGSPEYRESLDAMRPALIHHYAKNSHHPEHFTDGVDGMSIFDVLEMLCDWKAAGERHPDGSMERSLRVNRGRFEISEQLQSMLENTSKELGWL